MALATLVLTVAVAVAAVVQVVSGFGFALVLAPVLVATTDPVTSVSILAVLGTLVSAVTLAAGRRRPEIDRRASATLVGWALPGLALGLVLVTRLPEDAVHAGIALVIVLALVQRRRIPAARGASRPSALALAAAGATSGVLSTSTGLNGPPLVAVLVAHATPPRRARDTLAVVFVALGVAATVVLLAAGELTIPTAALVLPPAAIAGGLLGHRLFDRLTGAHREAAVTVVLLGAAATALVPVLT